LCPLGEKNRDRYFGVKVKRAQRVKTCYAKLDEGAESVEIKSLGGKNAGVCCFDVTGSQGEDEAFKFRDRGATT